MNRIAEDDLLAREFDQDGLVELRHGVERCCVSSGLADEALYWFVVAVNEITTNAVRHGGGWGRLRLWRADDYVYCQVADRGPGIPPHQDGLVRPSPLQLGGRGLWLARQGCETVVLDVGPQGSTVTLSQPLHPAR